VLLNLPRKRVPAAKNQAIFFARWFAPYPR
jgi:hypothetical protein